MGLIREKVTPPTATGKPLNDLNSDELQLLLNTLSSSVIQIRGKDLDVLYGLIVKLQHQYNAFKK